MVRIGICDDEGMFCDQLAEKVSGIMEDLSETCEICSFNRPGDLLNATTSFDILLLDIQMPEMSGMELARILREQGNGCAIIFITVLRDYVFDAFEWEAAGYLCKPVDDEKLRGALKRAVSRVNRAAAQRLAVQTKNGWKSIPIHTIYFCEVINRKIYLHTTDGVVDYYGKLEELEKRLDAGFYRCHRSYLVNLDRLSAYTNGRITLENQEQVPVSRLRQKEFMEVMLHHLKSKKI